MLNGNEMNLNKILWEKMGKKELQNPKKVQNEVSHAI